MKKKIFFIMALSIVSMAFSGCGRAEENLNTGSSAANAVFTINETADTEPVLQAPVQDDEVKNEADAANDNVQQTEENVQMTPEDSDSTEAQVTEAPATETPAVETPDKNAYPYPEDIDSSAVLTMNEDGSVKALLADGAVELTLTDDFVGNMVIRDNAILSKIAYNNSGTGTVLALDPYDHFKGYCGASLPVCYVDGVYWYWYRPTDCRCDSSNPEEYAQHSKLYEAIDEHVRFTFYGCSKETGEKTKKMPLPEGYNGMLRKSYSSTKGILGYTSEYVLENAEQGNQWEMEEGKNITAKSIAYSRGKMWFECYDTDNNEYYGWVSDENVAFYECEGTKGTSYQSVNSPVYGEIK